MYEDNDRLEKQLAFIRELDRLKTVKRRTYLLDGSRTENSAEHSWHAALMALLLLEYAEERGLDAFRVVRLLLLHDVVEIEAGDTYLYDEKAAQSQPEREDDAAAKLFGILPEDQGREFEAMRREYESLESPEARFVKAIDRFQPLYHNYLTQGKAWREHGVTSGKVRKMTEPIGQGSSALGELAGRLIDTAVERGYLAP